MLNLDYIKEIESREILAKKGLSESPSELEMKLYFKAKEEFKTKLFKVLTNIFKDYNLDDVIRFSEEKNAFISNRKYIEFEEPITLDIFLNNSQYFEETYPVDIPQLNRIIEKLTELRRDLECSSSEIIQESLENVKKNLRKVFEI